MYFIVILIIIATIISIYFTKPKKPKKQKIHRCSTKCFDCINNNKSLNRLNVSHGYPLVYAT